MPLSLCIRLLTRFAGLLLAGVGFMAAADSLPISYQVNVGPDGKNIPQDAANEPSLCVDPTNPLRMAVGWSDGGFVFLRSRNATNASASLVFDLKTSVDMGGTIDADDGPNPGGLLGQPWIAADRSSGPTRGNLYTLCSVSRTSGAPTDVLFSRSTNGGAQWSSPIALNNDSAKHSAWHWFGSLGVAPNGRIDACWYDTRSVADNHLSELYYTSSSDGGLTWSTNRPISNPFDHSVGYPTQEKLGDYIQLVSLDDAACIAYSATFNGEEDILFVSVDQPLVISIASSGPGLALSWKAATGRSFAVQMKTDILTPWSSATELGTVIAFDGVGRFEDHSLAGATDRFFRVVRLP